MLRTAAMPDSSTSRENQVPPRDNVNDSVNEVVDYVKAYVRQETLEPLRGWGRYVGFGVAGAVLAAAGIVVALLGLLRLLQTEVDAFDGPNTSILAYLVTLCVGLIVVGLVIWQVKRRTSLQREENG
jgi:hypothetical protein